jgi:hypothetical protein
LILNVENFIFGSEIGVLANLSKEKANI